MKNIKKSFIISGILLATGIAVFGYYLVKQQRYAKESVPAAADISQLVKKDQGLEGTSPTAGGNTMERKPQQDIAVPSELNIGMTFYPQAPFGNWDYPWQEACEEASLLLVANTYFHHNWTREDFRDEILKLVDWENKMFGDYKHTNVLQNSRILKEYLGLESVVVNNPSLEDVQRALAKGHLIIMGFAGKRLGNPNYKNGGPNYHAMVVKGYKVGEKIITDDVGTKNGEDYVYSWATVDNALHDFADPIESGAKRMIEVTPLNSLSNGQ